MTSAQALQEIALKAEFYFGLIGSLQYRTSRDYVIRGKPIPEIMLPGRMILNMTSEEIRVSLKQLTSEDAINCRWPIWIDEPKKEPMLTRQRKRVYSFRK